MAFKTKAELAAEKAAAEQVKSEPVVSTHVVEAPAPPQESKLPETITVSPSSVSTPAPVGGPAYFTVTVDGLCFTPTAKQKGLTGQQYVKGQFYATSPFLRHIAKKGDGAVVAYTGDAEVRKENIYATPYAPYEWTEPETEEVPDLFTGEEMS